MIELTKEQAGEFYKNETWKKLSDIERSWFQLYQKYLAMPFSEFHRCIEVLLDRPVFTHEFASAMELKIEAITKKKATFQQVIDKLPRDKKILIVK